MCSDRREGQQEKIQTAFQPFHRQILLQNYPALNQVAGLHFLRNIISFFKRKTIYKWQVIQHVPL